jgi:lysophospholipase L1-like esterase
MSIQVSYKKQGLFGIILVIILLSSIEVSMKIYDFYSPNCKFIESDVFNKLSFEIKRQICEDNSKLIWNNYPMYLIPNQHFSTININSQGFRGDEIQENPDYRIFVIGGSTTFGVGTTTDNETIPSHLQQIITKNFSEKRIEVINAGIPMAYSNPEKYLIENTLLKYEPNLLIIYDGWNDIERDYEQYDNSIDPNFMYLIVQEIFRMDISTPKVLLKWYFNYKHDTVDTIVFNSEKINQKVSLWVNSWENICGLQKKHDFKTIIFLQPLLGTGNKELSNEEQEHAIYYDVKVRNQNYELYANALDKIDLTCTASFDLRNGFDSHPETIYFDSGHVGDKGNEIIAEKIYEKMLPIMIKDIKK